MGYIVHLKDTLTGHTGSMNFNSKYYWETWEDGDYSCDCNRFRFLHDLEYEDDTLPCNTGDNRVIVTSITDHEGKELFNP